MKTTLLPGESVLIETIRLTNVTSKHSPYARYIRSDDAYPVENIVVEDCAFDGVTKRNLLQGYKHLVFRNVTINGEDQPERVK